MNAALLRPLFTPLLQEAFTTQAILVHVRGFIGQVAWCVGQRLFHCFYNVKRHWAGLRLVRFS
jgi:hypothetical protein